MSDLQLTDTGALAIELEGGVGGILQRQHCLSSLKDGLMVDADLARFVDCLELERNIPQSLILLWLRVARAC